MTLKERNYKILYRTTNFCFDLHDNMDILPKQKLEFDLEVFIMHISFVTLGAFGHINPTLALVTELIKRGVRVTYFSPEAFREIIEPTGARFVPVPSWMAENDKHNDGGDENQQDDGGVAAVVPFLFLKEAGAYIDTVLDTLKRISRMLLFMISQELPGLWLQIFSKYPILCCIPAIRQMTLTR